MYSKIIHKLCLTTAVLGIFVGMAGPLKANLINLINFEDLIFVSNASNQGLSNFHTLFGSNATGYAVPDFTSKLPPALLPLMPYGAIPPVYLDSTMESASVISANRPSTVESPMSSQIYQAVRPISRLAAASPSTLSIYAPPPSSTSSLYP